jgi:hypothetical protein
MTIPGALTPTHKAIKAYREAQGAHAGQQVTHEGATETAFQRLLSHTAGSHGWMRGYPLTITIFEDTTRAVLRIAV